VSKAVCARPREPGSPVISMSGVIYTAAYVTNDAIKGRLGLGAA
jgi:hypothetical protein